MGGKTATQTTTANSSPWSEQAPYITEGMAEAKKLYQSAGPSYFPSSTVAGFSPEQQQGLTMASNRATNGSASMKAAEGYNADVLNGKYSTDPYQSQVFENLSSSIMPRINAQFSEAGRYGSGAHQDTMGRTLMESFAPYASQIHQQGLDRMGSAAAMAPQFAANDYNDINALLDAGGMKQQLAQSEIEDAKSRYDYAQDMPANKLGQYMGFVGGNYGGNTTTSTPYYKPSLGSQILGGGLGLLGML